MKRLTFFIIILFSTFMFAQNWTNVIDTDVNVSSAITPVDVFANGFGLHVIYTENNALKYCRMDVLGNKYAGSPVTLESSSVIWPSITGDANIIYVVYRKSSEDDIWIKYSTNNGSNWSSLSNINDANASFIESVFSVGRLHVTYSISNSVYYTNYTSSWSSPYIVSSTENGNVPRIVAWYGNNENKVYFYYQNSSSVCKWREYNVATNSWGNIQTAFSVTNSTPSGFAVDGSKIALFYNYYAAPIYYFQWVIRSKSNNSLLCTRTAEPSDPQILYSTTTVDEQMHAVFWFNWYADEQEIAGIWRSRGDDNCSIDEVYADNSQEQQNVHFINTSASSNDVYVIWQDDYIGDNLRLIYDDQTPLTPQNLAVTGRDFGQWSHPVLSWSFNNEPDVYANDNGYEIQRRTRTVPGNFGNWSTIAYTEGDEKTYMDDEIIIEGAGTLYQAEYRIRAIDVGNNISGWSSTVSIYFGQFGKMSNGTQKYEYQLYQNHPNPFNPSTTINYSIETNGLVTLKVYDMLGTEVASLVNENKAAGSYSVVFNASNLPSGIYFCTLTSGNFIATKKLTLLK